MLIGISGKLGSGKNTIGEIIRKYKPEYEIKSFANKLKYITGYLTNESITTINSQEGKNKYLPEWEMTIGEFLQKMGTECMRNNIHKDGWILSLFNNYTITSKWIITDCRFENEAQAIKNRNGILIKVIGDPVKIRKKSSRKLNHPSEIGLDNWKKWDCIIHNDRDLNYLESVVKSYLDLLQFEKKYKI